MKIDGLSQYSHNFVNMQVNIKIDIILLKQATLGLLHIPLQINILKFNYIWIKYKLF